LKRLIVKIKRNIVDKITNIDAPLINFLENFDRLIHLFLAIVIVFTSLAIFMWFIHDAYELFEKITMFKKNISSSALKLFGTAILLWPLSALLRAEIKLVRGEQISLNLFVDTAIASTVRSFLISTEERKSLSETYYLIIALIVFAIVRLIVAYTEKISTSNSRNKEQQ